MLTGCVPEINLDKNKNGYRLYPLDIKPVVEYQEKDTGNTETDNSEGNKDTKEPNTPPPVFTQPKDKGENSGGGGGAGGF